MEPIPKYEHSEPVNMLHIALLKQQIGSDIQNLEHRIDLNFAETDKKIDALEAKLDNGFATIETTMQILIKAQDSMRFDNRLLLGVLATTLIGGMITGIIKLFMG